MYKIIVLLLILIFTSPIFAKGNPYEGQLDNLSSFDRKESNKKYSAVVESLLWVTDKKTLTVYRTSTFKNGSPYNPPMVDPEKNKGKAAYFGQQEFNDKTKNFVFSGNAINMFGGWVKREDVVPLNVLSRQYDSDKFFAQYFIVRKCPDVLKARLAKLNNGITFEDYLAKQDMLYRSYEIGYCATTSELECRSTLGNLKSEIDRKSCGELFKLK